jgi:hypothetical protein
LALEFEDRNEPSGGIVEGVKVLADLASEVRDDALSLAFVGAAGGDVVGHGSGAVV